MARPLGQVTAADIEILARTLYGEARSEGVEGMEAVADVVLNRWYDERWPESIAEVCQQPNQFSCWNANDPNRRLIQNVGFEDMDYRRAYAVAATAVADLLPRDLTKGANHYLNPEAVAAMPGWAADEVPDIAIGRHEFYKL